MRRVAVMLQGVSLQTPFVEGLHELGYRPGHDLAIETRGTNGNNQRFPALIAELIATKPEVLIAETTPGALAAKRATATIPIVFVNVSDPVGSGLVDSLARPGGNITGVTDFGTELGEKAVDLVRGVVPKAVRLGVLMSNDNPVHPAQFEVIRSAAARVSLAALPYHVATSDHLDQVFSAMVAQRVDAFLPLGGAPLNATYAQVDTVIRLAAQARLPAVYLLSDAVRRGGLMSYSTSFAARWKQAAIYLDRILKGAKPAELPVLQPTEFQLMVNRTTAAKLGIEIPSAVLLRAELVD